MFYLSHLTLHPLHYNLIQQQVQPGPSSQADSEVTSAATIEQQPQQQQSDTIMRFLFFLYQSTPTFHALARSQDFIHALIVLLGLSGGTAVSCLFRVWDGVWADFIRSC